MTSTEIFFFRKEIWKLLKHAINYTFHITSLLQFLKYKMNKLYHLLLYNTFVTRFTSVKTAFKQLQGLHSKAASK